VPSNSDSRGLTSVMWSPYDGCASYADAPGRR
jgi:hypothetical protein